MRIEDLKKRKVIQEIIFVPEEQVNLSQNFFMKMCRRHIHHNEGVVSLLSPLAALGIYYPMFLLPHDIKNDPLYEGLFYVLSMSGIFFFVGLFTYPAWPPTFRHKDFIAGIFLPSFLLTTTSIPTFLVLLSKLNPENVMYFMYSMGLTILYLRLRMAIFMIVVGCFMGALFFKYWTGLPFPSLDPDLQSLYGKWILWCIGFAMFKQVFLGLSPEYSNDKDYKRLYKLRKEFRKTIIEIDWMIQKLLTPDGRLNQELGTLEREEALETFNITKSQYKELYYGKYQGHFKDMKEKFEKRYQDFWFKYKEFMSGNLKLDE